MIDPASGELVLADGCRVGPNTRADDLLASPLAALIQRRGACEFRGEMKAAQYVSFIAQLPEAGPATPPCRDWHVKLTFWRGWLAEVDLRGHDHEYLLNGVAHDGSPRRNVPALRRLHADRLRRWLGRKAVSHEYPWGRVERCSTGDDPPDPDEEPECLIRISYTEIPPEPEVVPWSGLLLAGRLALACGILLVLWRLLFWRPPAEAVAGMYAAWLTPLWLVGGGSMLLLLWDCLAGGIPLSEEDALRWPCPCCRDASTYDKKALVEEDGKDGWPRLRCPACGAPYYEDPMSWHPHLFAELEPRSEQPVRWPWLSGRYRLPARFRPPGTDPETHDAAQDCVPFLKALERSVTAPPPLRSVLLAAVVMPLTGALLAAVYGADGLSVAAWAGGPLSLGLGLLRVSSGRAATRRFRLSLAPQIERYLKKTALTPQAFIALARQHLGASSPLLAYLERLAR